MLCGELLCGAKVWKTPRKIRARGRSIIVCILLANLHCQEAMWIVFIVFPVDVTNAHGFCFTESRTIYSKRSFCCWPFKTSCPIHAPWSIHYLKATQERKIVLDNTLNFLHLLSVVFASYILVPRFLFPQVHINCDFWTVLSGTPLISYFWLTGLWLPKWISALILVLCLAQILFSIISIEKLSASLSTWQNLTIWASPTPSCNIVRFSTLSKWWNSHSVRSSIKDLDNIFFLDINKL